MDVLKGPAACYFLKPLHSLHIGEYQSRESFASLQILQKVVDVSNVALLTNTVLLYIIYDMI